MKTKKTNEELVALIQSGTDVQENMAVLYKQCKNYMYWIARKFPTNDEEDVNDLLQEGYFGLMDAVNRFDAGDASFLTYAKFRIQAHMYNHFQKMRYAVSTSNVIWKIANKYRKGDEVSESDIELLQRLDSVNLYAPIRGTSSNISEVIADDTNIEETVLDEIYKSQQKKILWDCVNSLSKKQAQVITEKYKNNKTNSEIANSRGVSEPAISHLEERALSLLWEKDEIQAMRDDYDYLSEGLRRTGFMAWKETGESSVERAVSRKIVLETKWKARLSEIEQELIQLNNEQQQVLETLFEHPIDEIIPCILKLPNRLLEAFMMRTVEGERNMDVAKKLNMNKTNVYLSNKTAISKIQAALAV